MLKWIALGVVGLVLLGSAVGGLYLAYLGRAGADPAFFASEIDAFVEADREHPPAPGQIVFVGSSSIRFWTSLEEDMRPLPVVRRGFGGAQLVHLIHEAGRVVIPYAPRAVVVYAGDNDIGAGKSAEQVVADFDALLAKLRAALPETDVWFLSIKPSRLRWSLWPEIQRANEAIRSRAEADPLLRHLDVGSALLGDDGLPEPANYRFDGLHLSPEGYAVWTAIVKPALLEAYGEGDGPLR